MTRTELRLADALDAAAGALREDTLRPLLVPDRQRHRPALVAPLAAAAALLLVVGLGVVVARFLPGSDRPTIAAAPPRYFVEAQVNGSPPVVRSTATGAVTGTVPVPHADTVLGSYLVATAANGVFFAAAPLAAGERIYRFRLTAAGGVGEFSAVPGDVFASSQWAARAIAASPDGSQVAVAVTPMTGSGSASCSSTGPCSSTLSGQADQIDVVNTVTGATSVWAGGIDQNYAFNIINLSWVRNTNELVYYGQWCPQGNSSTSSSTSTSTGTSTITSTGTSTDTVTACELGSWGGGEKAEVWALDHVSAGGKLNSGRRLFSLSARYPYLPQISIGPDGSTITAVALTTTTSGKVKELAVEQIPHGKGKPPSVLYTWDLSGPENIYPVTLSADGAGQHWLLSGTFCGVTRCSGGFNGWIEDGRLVPLQPSDGSVASEAW